MWHTLIDDPTSYVEASATSGFGYGILKAVHMGLVDAAYAENAKKALAPILKCIREDGIVDQVSYGTAMAGRQRISTSRSRCGRCLTGRPWPCCS